MCPILPFRARSKPASASCRWCVIAVSECSPDERRRQAKLARSAGASPAQVGLSKPPDSECCVSRRQRRPRSVHSDCVGCVSEPRNGLFAGVETVLMVEHNTSNAVMRGIVRPAGVKEHITRGRIVLELGISRVRPSADEVGGPHREGEEP
jgi:hypothetical protein